MNSFQILNGFWNYVKIVDVNLAKLRHNKVIKQLCVVDRHDKIISKKNYEVIEYTQHNDLSCDVRSMFVEYIDDLKRLSGFVSP
jgi:predicted SnoaL-like aldol condensation-catalyzing enzyme